MAQEAVYLAAYEPPTTGGIPTGDTDVRLRCVGGGPGGASMSYASVPDAAALDLSTSLEITVRVAPDVWASGSTQTLAAKWNPTGNQRSYAFNLTATGRLELVMSTNGTNSLSYTSNVALPDVAGLIWNGWPMWLRVNWSSSDGWTIFRWSRWSNGDMPQDSAFTVLGTQQGSQVTPLYTGTANFTVGSISGGATPLSGDVERVVVRNGTTRVLDIDFTTKSSGTLSLTAETGQTVTLTSGLVTYPWYVTVQMLMATGGARVGLSRVGTARVSQYGWFDLWSYVAGVEWTRGTPPSGQGPPKMNVGTAQLLLDNTRGTEAPFKAWHPATTYTATGWNTSILNREFRPGAVIRIAAYRKNGPVAPSTQFRTSSYIGTAHAPVYQHWQPLFTGIVEDWQEKIELGRDMVQVNLVEPTALLGSCNCSPVVSQGLGEGPFTRLIRLLQEAGYPFWCAAGSDPFSTPLNLASSVTLQATTMSMNRWQECLNVGDSCGEAVWTGREGNITFVRPTNYRTTGGYLTTTSTSSTVTSEEFSPVAMLSWKSGTTPSQDWYKFPSHIKGTYVPPLMVTNNTDFVVNEVTAESTGGVFPYTSKDTLSQSAFGKRSIQRTDLMAQTGGSLFAIGVVADYSGWSSEPGQSDTMDQTLQPGQVVVVNQQRIQRAMDLFGLMVIDYGDEDDTRPEIRFLTRCMYQQHKIVPAGGAAVWTTTYGLFSVCNYKPNA